MVETIAIGERGEILDHFSEKSGVNPPFAEVPSKADKQVLLETEIAATASCIWRWHLVVSTSRGSLTPNLHPGESKLAYH